MDASKELQEQFEIDSQKYAERSSERETIATKAEREAESIKKAEFMESRIGQEYDAIISSITPFGMFAELENTVEGLIRFEDMGDEYFIYDEERKQLIGEHTNKVYKIGDKIRIVVIKANKTMRQIDFSLINNIDEIENV